MATCKAVVVLCPNGRKVNVKIVPNSTVSKILEEVCKKQGVNPKEHGIKHQRKVLDNALPVKFSNLPNNAHLELVTETAPVKQGTSCTVALQLENGERLIHSFQPSSTLWDVLIHWDSQKERENEAKLTTRSSGDMIQLEPVCINMAEEIQGERNLRSTTLQSIGLSSGRAVIRLIHREAAPSSHLTSVPSESYDTNAMDIESQTEKSDQPDTHVAKSHDHLSSESIDRQESASSESADVTSTDIYPVASTVKEKKEILRKETNAASNDACNTSVKDISVQPQRSVTNSSVTSPSACVSSSSGLHIKEEDIPAIDFNAILEEERQRLRTEHDSKAERQAEGGLKKSKRPKLDHCAPLFPDFKFPEGKAEEEKHFASLTSAPDGIEDISCDRQPLIYSLDDVSVQGPENEDLPDEFFEVTVDDLRRMLHQLNQDKMKQELAPLLTKAQREAHEKIQMEKYTRVVIRIYFPDRFVLQGFFRPQEKVSAVLKFVKENLEMPSTKFYIYVAPPKRILDKPDINLYEAKLCPAAIIHFGSSEKQDHFLSSTHVNRVSSVLEAEQAVHRVMSSDKSKSDTLLKGSTQDNKQHSLASVENKTDTNNCQSNTSSSTSSSGSGHVPKWFKMGKK